MSTLFTSLQTKHPRKGPRTIRKQRIRKLKGGYHARWFATPGPAQGIRIVRDPDDPLFPRKWVLSFHDIVLGVFGRFPEELWTELASTHREEHTSDFRELPIGLQDIHRKWEDQRYRTMEFWDRVARTGKLPHRNHPDLRNDEQAAEAKRWKT